MYHVTDINGATSNVVDGDVTLPPRAVTSQALLYGANGKPLTLSEGAAVPSGTRVLPIGGRDDADNARFIRLLPDGAIHAFIDNTLKDRDHTTVLATPFNELRVAAPLSWLDWVNKYELDLDVWGTLTATGGTVTHVPLESAIRLAVTSTSGSRAVMRTNRYFRYQAGRAQLVRLTGYPSDAGQSNQNRYWGLFDDEDGLGFGTQGTTFGVFLRSSTSGAPVTTFTPRASFYDPLDGTGPSGIASFDITKSHIYEVVFQWLGVGVVLFYIDGTLVHVLPHAGIVTAPYMRTATLPVSLEMLNTGASAVASFTHICANVASLGGDEPPEEIFGAYNPADITVTATERPVLSIRPKLQYNSINNRMIIIPKLLIASAEGGRVGVRLIYTRSGTLTGASWVSVDAQSGTEYDVTSSTVPTGATILRSFIVSNGSVHIPLHDIFGRLRKHLHNSAFLTQPVLTVAMVRESGSNADCRASITFGEVR